MRAHIIGGPHHGQQLTFDKEHAPIDWRAPHPSDLAALLCSDRDIMAGPVVHHYRLAEFGVTWPNGRSEFHGLYIYQAPWTASRIAAFLYQRHLEGSRVSGVIFPAGREADAIRRHEELATGLSENERPHHTDKMVSDHWLRTRAAHYSDADGYRPDWAPEPAVVRTARALRAMGA